MRVKYASRSECTGCVQFINRKVAVHTRIGAVQDGSGDGHAYEDAVVHSSDHIELLHHPIKQVNVLLACVLCQPQTEAPSSSHTNAKCTYFNGQFALSGLIVKPK